MPGAFATRSGDQLWEIKLPSSIETTPITYQGSDGRQFVAVVSTGGGLTGYQAVSTFKMLTLLAAVDSGLRLSGLSR